MLGKGEWKNPNGEIGTQDKYRRQLLISISERLLKARMGGGKEYYGRHSIHVA
jgi:hypothetical protein